MRRQLGLVDVFAISTGAMFSSGFFLLPGLAFGRAGAWMILAYVLSALLVVPAMLSKAELASALPKAGGTYYFLDRSMGPLVGTVGGLGTWIAMGLKNTFALIGIGAYLALFVDLEIEVVAVSLAILFVAINVVGTRETARLQRWLVYALLTILVVFLLGAAVTVGDDLVDTTRARFAAAPDSDLDGVLATVGLVFVSYAGLTKVSGVAEEVERPHRNILLGMALSLGVAVSIYALGTYFIVLVVPADDLSRDLAPVATAAEAVLGWMPGRLGVALVVVAAVAAFASTANAGIMSASRYLLAMGRDRLIPSAFQQVGRFRTPTVAVLATGGFVVVALLTLDVVTVAKLASAFQLLMFALVNLAVIVMRESRIETYDPAARSPLYPWTQLLGIFLCLALIVEMGRMPMLFTLGLVTVGVTWFFVYGRHRVVRQGAILHWFERLGRERFDALETEMWDILRESGAREDDPYEELIRRAPILELDEPTSFDRVTELVAERMAPCVVLETATLARAFAERVHTGLVPVSDGVAMVHLHRPEQPTHELLLLRANEPVEITFEEGGLEGERRVFVEALFFLISPSDDPGQHLRLLARLTNEVDRPAFLPMWRASGSHEELRELMIEEPLRRLARRLMHELRIDPARTWHPRTEPGRFENVLAVDLAGALDPEVAAFAEALASANGAKLTLAEPAADPDESGTPAGSERLAEIARGLSGEGVDTRALALAGKPWLDVLREVVRSEYDLVIVATAARARGFDSDTQQLLRKCPCPVWVVRPGRAQRIDRVLAAIDVTATDRVQRSLNTQILGHAAAVAERMDADLHIVHAWRVVGEEQLRRMGMSARTAAGHDSDWRADYGRLVDELLEGHQLDAHRTHIHLIEGSPSSVIPRVAEQEEIDLIVMGTVCRTGVAGFLIGNTAESVLQEVGCAVLAVKPIGFETPVEGAPEPGAERPPRSPIP